MSNEKLIGFFSSWLVTALVILISSMVFSGNIVLGNDKVSMPMAAVVSGFVIALLSLLIEPAISKSGLKLQNKNLKLAAYLAANIVILWVLKRFALVLGLGISSLVYVGVLAAVLTLVQWAVTSMVPSIAGRKK